MTDRVLIIKEHILRNFLYFIRTSREETEFEATVKIAMSECSKFSQYRALWGTFLDYEQMTKEMLLKVKGDESTINLYLLSMCITVRDILTAVQDREISWYDVEFEYVSKKIKKHFENLRDLK